ncbi:MAG TPA: TetR/AcrR family transcriptional regulator [Pseudonocardiaceae bacterium]|jgi:AcrR family transcriptional regulator
MTGSQRRQQLLDVARALLAEKGFEATSVEEIAHRAAVSKPVVYAHFGGKEGIYAVVVDREMRRVLDLIESALAESGHPRRLIERAAQAFLAYVDEYPDGFRILVRDSPVASSTGTFSSLLGDIASQVEHLLGVHFEHYGYDPKLAAVYAQALVGMVALTGQWWLDARTPSRDEVAAHVVNLAWNGLSHLEHHPHL